jgi:hypothetical protein
MRYFLPGRLRRRASRLCLRGWRIWISWNEGEDTKSLGTRTQLHTCPIAAVTNGKVLPELWPSSCLCRSHTKSCTPQHLANDVAVSTYRRQERKTRKHAKQRSGFFDVLIKSNSQRQRSLSSRIEHIELQALGRKHAISQEFHVLMCLHLQH